MKIIIIYFFRVFLPLKELDDEGRLIVIIRTCVHNPSKHSIANVVKVKRKKKKNFLSFVLNF